MFRIDTHFHLFSPDAPACGGARYRPPYGASLAQWQAHAQACGVRAGVVVQPSFLGTDNGELLAALSACAALRGVCVLGADTDPAGLAGLHRAGVRGLRWNMVGRHADPAWRDPRWGQVLAAAHALGWHLELHADAGRLAELEAILPDVPIALVLDHFGKPCGDAGRDADLLACAVRWRTSREVFVKLSAPYRLPAAAQPREWTLRWRDCLGPGRLLWGSDWPWTNHEAGRDYAALAEQARRWLGPDHAAPDRNAAALFGFVEAAPA